MEPEATLQEVSVDVIPKNRFSHNGRIRRRAYPLGLRSSASAASGMTPKFGIRRDTQLDRIFAEHLHHGRRPAPNASDH